MVILTPHHAKTESGQVRTELTQNQFGSISPEVFWDDGYAHASRDEIEDALCAIGLLHDIRFKTR